MAEKNEALKIPDVLGTEGEPFSEEAHILQVTREYYQESDGARFDRMALNRRNRNCYMGRQDWGHKDEGQSTEFIPKTGSSVESFAAFIKRGLTQFGNWFSVDVPQELGIRGDDIVAIIRSFMDRMPDNNNSVTSFAHRLSDGSKSGLLESYFIFKVYGHRIEKKSFQVRGGKTRMKTIKPWKLRIDLIRTENYYPDPTGSNMYEIHEVERDLSEVIKMADKGQYDKDAVLRLIESMPDHPLHNLSVDDRKRDLNIDETEKPRVRKKVTIRECWGNILDDDGTMLYENVTWTVANDTYLLRKPTKNPYWHNRSPFVCIPLIRVPHTVFHKALYDQGVALNEAMNELFNLMLDGGIASVWGIKQVNPNYLEDPRQISDGIPQGTTLVLNESAPPGEKVLEQVATGEVPGDAMAMYNVLDKEFNAAVLTNDIKMGLLPTKEVKATEIVEASQSQAVTLDSIVSDIEWYIEEIVRMSWMLILQNAPDIETLQIDSSAGRRFSLLLARLSDAERYGAFGSMTSFKVYGLTATLARARDFQRLMALLQAIQVNPMLQQSFHRRYSEDKILQQLMKNTNMNPEMIERTPEEMQQIDKEIEDAAKLNAAGVTGNNTASPPGEAGMQSEVRQNQMPSSGV